MDHIHIAAVGGEASATETGRTLGLLCPTALEMGHVRTFFEVKSRAAGV